MTLTLLSYLYAIVTVAVVGFQFALAAGAPWGHLAMGGRYPGQLPTGVRIAAIVQAAFLGFLALVVLSKAGQIDFFSGSVDWLVWIVVAVNVLALVANLATPSKEERRLWAPVAILMLVTSVIVALS